MQLFDIGDVVTVRTLLQNAAGAATDPTTLTLTVTNPSGTPTVYTYGSGTIVRDAAGSYHADLSPNAAGVWTYTWTATGTAAGAESASFTVRTPAGSSYAAWPAPGDVDALLASIGVTLRTGATAARKQEVLDAVVSEVGVATRRQFQPDAVDSIRYFDGSGTPELELDEYRSVTTVRILGPAASGTGALTLTNWAETVDALLPKTRILLCRGAGVWYRYPLLTLFPQGRQNIEVTGRWGYADQVPADLWTAVQQEAALRLAREAVYTPGYDAATGEHKGRLVSYTEADGTTEKYEFVPFADALGWHAQFLSTVKRYVRPAGRHLRRLRAPML